ncbi:MULTISPECIES: 50S ribosomal protein L22 [Petrotoga]|uniref:Large ribosomal subunit protein uL22 n=2 Tax=Petrotoga sibirica TaxID=156202 RepID=A0A4R8F0I1_9BACT|nr:MULTISPECIES: 50S ribosomal protein L22 [Petrotoga]POZ88915.1 50S ribosomal protein L22 [Petrotoga sibirica DSM 13575]POZ91152.1 50S ribosomal protein L22 [Petrotoga sp. SL27]TDX15571.1 LSU ribosomal protein L22P [Petrotoga sibirica]
MATNTNVSRVQQDGRKVKRSVYHRLRKEKEASEPIVEARAVTKYVRISPKKVRSMANSIRNKDISEALQILTFSPKKSARILYKTLMSAIANAENNFGLNAENLYVSEIMVNEGPRLKRLWPRSHGRADILQKRMSHIYITVRDKSADK